MPEVINVAVGMMDPAYFTGRREVLDWLNSTLNLSLDKIEQTASGAVALQIFDYLFPENVVPLHRVNWGAKNEYEYVQNYILLQNVFKKLDVDKTVPVDRLVRGKYQDNFEFMQWLMKFFEANCNGKYVDSQYPAAERRSRGKNAGKFSLGKGRSAPKNNKVHAKPKEQKKSVQKKDDKEVIELKKQVEEARKAYIEREEELDNLEKERDFYFNKLRLMESTLQKSIESGEVKKEDEKMISYIQDLFTLLYQADGEDEDGKAEQSAIKAVEEALKMQE
eukprot:maker-scaffold_8-snap-gene-9.20-mRNA-1 protein AED:0.01 eAED:0.01 QI:276/1/1/1/1/1/2/432/277